MIKFVSLQICRSMNGLMEAWRLEERILTCGPLLGKGLTSTSGWEDWRNHSYEIGIIKHRVHSIHSNNVIISSQKSPPYSKSASHQALTNSGEGWSIRRQTLGNFTKEFQQFCLELSLGLVEEKYVDMVCSEVWDGGDASTRGS